MGCYGSVRPGLDEEGWFEVDAAADSRASTALEEVPDQQPTIRLEDRIANAPAEKLRRGPVERSVPRCPGCRANNNCPVPGIQAVPIGFLDWPMIWTIPRRQIASKENSVELIE
jgi:hypothetical protein